MATIQKLSADAWLDAQTAKGAYYVHACMGELTPELAQILLDRNDGNRTINPNRVTLYASDIIEGRWVPNGESVIVSDGGFLNDGQHRCAAVIEADAPITTLFVFGVDRESRKTTNMGKVKGAGDFAAMEGLPNGNVLAGMARLAISFESGKSSAGGQTASTPVVLEYIIQNQAALIESMHIATRHSGKMAHMISATPVAFCHYVCAKINKAAADEFFTQICTGEMLAAGDPAFVTRARMMQLGKTRAPKIEAMFHGWNAFRRGQSRTIIRLTGTWPPLV